MRKRLDPEDRKASILEAAVKVAQSEGFHNLTRDGVARAARVSPGLVTRYFYAVSELRRAVMTVAVERRLLPLVAQGIVMRHAVALEAPEEVRQQALVSL